MAQYRIPQNIDLPDRIIGPLTLMQFLYLLFGALGGYALFKFLDALFFTAFALFLTAPVILMALALAFVKVNEQPFLKFLFAFFQFSTSSKIKIWQKQEIIEEKKEIKKIEIKKEETRKPEEIRSRLEELTMVIQTKGWSMHFFPPSGQTRKSKPQNRRILNAECRSG